MSFIVSEITIYPIKSLGGISLQEAKVEERGLQYDRRWVLVDENNVFITQRQNEQMALIDVAIDEDMKVRVVAALDGLPELYPCPGLVRGGVRPGV